MRNKLALLVGALAFTLVPAVASAHVIVTPDQAGIGSDQAFTTNVPNERDVAVTGLRLVMPAGLKEVSPDVKAGWTIDETKSGTGDDATVTEITWTGGQIPVGQRDQFSFGAQVPGTPTTLDWKAYQTYADGTVVAWDQTPTGTDDDSMTPYSTTKVVDDLTAAAKTDSGHSTETDVALALSIVALLVAAGALTLGRR